MTVSGTVDVAVARAQHRLRPRFDAGMLGVGVQGSTRQIVLSAQGVITTAIDSLGAALATFGVGYQPLRASWTRTDAALSMASFGVDRSGIPNSSRGGSSLVGLSQSVMRAFPIARVGSLDGSLSIGYAEGRSRRSFTENFGRGAVGFNDDFRASSIVAAAALEHRFARIGVSTERARTDDYDLLEDSGFGLRRFASAYDLRDVTVHGTARAWRVEASVVHSTRRGLVQTFGKANATSVAVGVRLTDALSLHGAAGRQLFDVMRGLAPARVSMLALRWRFGAPHAAAASRDGEVRVGSDAIVVRVTAPAGARVEVAGSWNDWTPVALDREGEAFVARLALASGTHRIAVRIDGGAWRAPKGLARASDDFGGEVGILVVP